jgi:hypothetical protein
MLIKSKEGITTILHTESNLYTGTAINRSTASSIPLASPLSAHHGRCKGWCPAGQAPELDHSYAEDRGRLVDEVFVLEVTAQFARRDVVYYRGKAKAGLSTIGKRVGLESKLSVPQRHDAS